MTGHVFVLRKKPTSSTIVPGNVIENKCELLEGINFSITQLRLFHKNLEYQKYNGLPFYIQVDGHLLKMPVLLGKNKLPNLDNLEEIFEKEVSVAKELNFVENEEDDDDFQKKCDALRESRMGLFWALTNPGRNVLKQDFLFAIGPFTYIDDMLENFGNEFADNLKLDISRDGKRTRLSYKITSPLLSMFVQALKNAGENSESEEFLEILDNPMKLVSSLMDKDGQNYDEILEMDEGVITDLYTVLDFVQGFISMVRKETLKTAKKNGCSATQLFQCVTEAMDAYCLEYSSEWHEEIMSDGGNRAKMLDVMTSLKRITVAGKLFVESFLLQRGINLGENVRGSIIFKLILEQVSIHFQKVNDLVSYEKEMKAGKQDWKSNEACVLHKMKNMSVSDAKKKMADDANTAIDQIQVLCKLMLNLWKDKEEEKNVAEFVDVVVEIVTGHLQWNVIGNRYLRNSQVDCFIQAFSE